jgi:hypothetical protein
MNHEFMHHSGPRGPDFETLKAILCGCELLLGFSELGGYGLKLSKDLRACVARKLGNFEFGFREL